MGTPTAERPDFPFPLDSRQYPFEHRWYGTSGARVHYVDEGQGRPVLFLHGNPTWSYLYRHMIRELREEVRCVAPDYPGFGGSRAPEEYGFYPREHAAIVGALVDHLELDNLILVGHDWGGPIGLSLLADRPDRVDGVVLCNTWCWEPDWLMWLFSILVGGPVGRYLCEVHNFFVRSLMPLGVYQWGFGRGVPEPYLAPFDSRRRRRATWVFPRSLRTQAPWVRSIAQRLEGRSHPPVDLVVGDRDRFFGRETVIRRWRAIFPDLTLHRVTEASHYLQEDRPEALTDVIRTAQKRLGSP